MGAVLSITFRQVRYFLAAAETGQISQAAVEMNISQSAVTAAVQGLEAQLGVKLLDRGPTGVVLTPEGARFLIHAKAIIAAVEDAERSPGERSSEITGRVRVGVTYTVAGYFMPRHFVRFRRSHPGIRVDLVELPRAAIEESLASGDIDIAVMLVSNLANQRTLAYETLFRSHRRLWLSADHRLAQADRILLSDLADEPYVMLTVDEAAKTASRYWDLAGLEPNVVFATSSVEAVRSMVAAGIGVTILSDMVYRPFSLEGQRIEVRALDHAVPSMDVGLAWHRDRDLSRPAQSFRAFMSVALGGGGPQG